VKNVILIVSTFAVCAVLLSGSLSCRQTKTADAAEVEREIREVDRARTQALRSGDTAALARLYSDDFTMITSTGEIRTKQDQLRDIRSKVYQHQGPDPKIVRLSVHGDVAIVVSESRGELITHGQPDDVLRRYTRVYAKNNGRWQLTATHISKVTQP